MKSIESRFMDRVRSWTIKCRCGQSITIGSGGSRRVLPPNVVIKKLRAAGWYIGNKAGEDLCSQCQRKPIKSKIDTAKKALTAMVAPMVSNGSERLHFSQILAVAKTLNPEEAKQLITVLRERIPKAEPRQKKVQEVMTKDNDYERWLDE